MRRQSQSTIVDVTGDRSKVQRCNEQYCVGTWNFRSMNQGKLEVVKQEMARVNIDILGINELKWTGMGEFNSDYHYIYYCGQESLRRNGVAIIVNKSLKCSTWVQYQKWRDDLCSFPRQTIQYHSNPSLCPNQYAEEAEVERFYEDLQDLLELTPKKDVLFIIGSQETPGGTGKFGLGMWNEAGQRLVEFCQENTLVIANTLIQQHKKWLYTWTSPDDLYWNQIDYIICSRRWSSFT